MDLGIEGRTAVVCASSQGLGRACATALAEAGCDLVINGRDAAALEATAQAIRDATGSKVTAVAADLNTAEGRAALLAAAPAPDILVNNNGGPPPKDFREIDRTALEAGVAANMLVPITLVQAVIDGMIERRFGRIVNITSSTVKAPLSGLDLSSGARLGLTGFLAGVARQVAHANVTINFLLPGSFDTRRLSAAQQFVADKTGKSLAEVRESRRLDIPAQRFGDPAEFGRACAFLCSAGYITGQTLLLDGGAFPGVM